MKYLLILSFPFILIGHAVLYAQDTISNEKIYIDNDLVFKYSDGQPFSGVAQVKRKNGQVQFEMEYDDGVILKQYVYYRRKKKDLATKIIYDSSKPWTELKEIRYFSGIEQWTHYGTNGKRKLKEQRRNGKLFYSCEYAGRKKHGQEICLNDDGTKTVIEYRDGKKVKKG